MPWLILGLIILIGGHAVPSMPGLKAALIEQWGAKGYRIAFNAVSVVGLVLIIYGKLTAPIVPLWQPPLWARPMAVHTMPLAFILVMAQFLPGYIQRFTKVPALWGVTLWAALHLLANGDLSSVVLFAGVGAGALVGGIMAAVRRPRPETPESPIWGDVAAVLSGALIYSVIIPVHGMLGRPLM